jgi:uncharacterized protein
MEFVMNNQLQILDKVKEFVKQKFNDFEGSHDWYHIERVHRMAIFLQEHEGGDKFLIELAALLHDISDHKYNGGNWEEGSKMTKELLVNFGLDEENSERVSFIVSQVSFKGAKVGDDAEILEAKIVQDADRLDAIGAIGIARAFSYGGSKKRHLYIPDNNPIMHETKDEYLNSESHTINHFYEKLFLLKDRMKTKTARAIAEQRHSLMENFVRDFYDEWFFPFSKK